MAIRRGFDPLLLVRQTNVRPIHQRTNSCNMVPCDGFAPTSPVLQTGAFTRLAYKALKVLLPGDCVVSVSGNLYIHGHERQVTADFLHPSINANDSKVWCAAGDSNSQNSVSKTDMYTNSITCALTKKQD